MILLWIVIGLVVVYAVLFAINKTRKRRSRWIPGQERGAIDPRHKDAGPPVDPGSTGGYGG